MALRNIVTVGDPVLTKKCRPVVKFDDRLAQLIDDMKETMRNANGVGLAAPQVGVLRRLVVSPSACAFSFMSSAKASSDPAM